MMSLAASYDVKNLGLYYTLPKSFGSLSNKCVFFVFLTFLHGAHYPNGILENQKQHSKEDFMGYLCRLSVREQVHGSGVLTVLLGCLPVEI